MLFLKGRRERERDSNQILPRAPKQKVLYKSFDTCRTQTATFQSNFQDGFEFSKDMDYKRDCKQRQNGGLQSAIRVGYNVT